MAFNTTLFTSTFAANYKPTGGLYNQKDFIDAFVKAFAAAQTTTSSTALQTQVTALNTKMATLKADLTTIGTNITALAAKL